MTLSEKFSVKAVLAAGKLPPAATAKVLVPNPAKLSFAVERPVGLDVQTVPFHFSVAVVLTPVGGVYPPKANEAV